VLAGKIFALTTSIAAAIAIPKRRINHALAEEHLFGAAVEDRLWDGSWRWPMPPARAGPSWWSWIWPTSWPPKRGPFRIRDREIDGHPGSQRQANQGGTGKCQRTQQIGQILIGNIRVGPRQRLAASGRAHVRAQGWGVLRKGSDLGIPHAAVEATAVQEHQGNICTCRRMLGGRGQGIGQPNVGEIDKARVSAWVGHTHPP
jgi:hypothetical protein